jgi:uncharacterized protein (TIGR02452 family)
LKGKMETSNMNQLTILPCLDNDEIAASRRHELAMPRDVAEELGRSAVEAADRGRYVAESGKEIFWKSTVEHAKRAKLSIPPELDLPSGAGVSFPKTIVQVSNETTLAAGKHLVDRGLRPLALNFANGVNPGGGFLTGARAQEEVLCRSSALYATILGDPMYESHRRRPRPDSTDWAILSPDVPVFREDNGRTLEQPWLLSLITCAAPYAPGVGQPEAGNLLQRRIHRVFEIARAYGYVFLVLGAWGCGAFENDPERTAKDFRLALDGDFRGAFSEVVFAITDWSADRRYLGPFRDVFAEA